MNFIINHSSDVKAYDNNELVVVGALWAAKAYDIDMSKCCLRYSPLPHIYFGVKTCQKDYTAIVFGDDNGPSYNYFSSMDSDTTIRIANSWILKHFPESNIKVIESTKIVDYPI